MIPETRFHLLHSFVARGPRLRSGNKREQSYSSGGITKRDGEDGEDGDGETEGGDIGGKEMCVRTRRDSKIHPEISDRGTMSSDLWLCRSLSILLSVSLSFLRDLALRSKREEEKGTIQMGTRWGNRKD